ncbi:hypothetical protein CMI37_27705 [Candidatus Pacearchaeota archaeon]|nr:hypothetical protein [Candidatus Pacearchaeota archaeon]
MKIYINRKPKTGPWGGGAKTVNKLVDHLTHFGHSVVYRLERGIDVIFCIDPRPNDYGENYHHLLQYKKRNSIKIIQRVGDVGTHGKPELTEYVKFCLDKSDFFIFPSEWAKEKIQFEGKNCSVIHNAPQEDFYNHRGGKTDISKKPKIITHHWSTNPKKGFDLYEQFDVYCRETGEYEFYYMGQVPPGVMFVNYHPPVDVAQLSYGLPKFDIYLTASEDEAGANHVLEALACGLPVVYRSSGGSIVNYCKKYGLEYSTFDELISSIKKVVDDYSTYKNEVLRYKRTNIEVVSKYYDIIQQVG